MSHQDKTPVTKSEVLTSLMEDLGLVKKETFSSALIALGVGYLSVEWGVWPLVLLFESGLWIFSLFNRKERAFEQLEKLDNQIEIIRTKCEWYYSEKMNSDDNDKFIACFYLLGPMVAQMKEKIREFMKKFGEEEKELCYLTIKYNVHSEKSEAKEEKNERVELQETFEIDSEK